jgi:hypothetical protein
LFPGKNPHVWTCKIMHDHTWTIIHEHVWILSLNNHICSCMIIHYCIWSCIILYPMKIGTWNPRSFCMDIIQVKSTWANNILKNIFLKKKKKNSFFSSIFSEISKRSPIQVATPVNVAELPRSLRTGPSWWAVNTSY